MSGNYTFNENKNFESFTPENIYFGLTSIENGCFVAAFALHLNVFSSSLLDQDE